ncbi:GSCFA domain-containing protein [Sabulilitoribacter arenilitoris]|uniref:GSCFA domain-containing protein n=1 Tax=Wocania arenilitoris TaxID=2044858 RepID=A0AAE3ERD6_9FLAO|nr:GSCFA domain-containing protein [Wocania arenilitoris]MCF7568874.1 GSCFA domain-containing protein [Wocania arenilitoris]
MKLQTKIPLNKQSNNLIDYNSNVLLLGSCFSENIGEKLSYFKFQNDINPFGILFHPKAIETLIFNAVNQKTYSEKDVFFQNEQWHCFDAHSKLSNISKEDLINQLNKKLNLTTKQLNNSSHIIITLGTAWVYNFIETNRVVANCHKVPQKQFKKELMSVDAVLKSLKSTVKLIKSKNPEASIAFTVSPVRHIKDGFVENTQSKAHLIAAIYQIINEDNSICYFPSYEIMMDELRDYRFYSVDMIHPNQIAINYIWEKFQSVWISDEASKIMLEIDDIQKGLNHKPFNLSSSAHQKFLQNLKFKIKELQSKFPNISF